MAGSGAIMATGDGVDGNEYPFNYPDAGFGQYCVRCHASAEKVFTFSALRNIAGEEGSPVSYRVDNSWMPTEDETDDPSRTHEDLAEEPDAAALAASKPGRDINPEFVALFDSIPPVAPEDVLAIPPVTYDHVIAGPDGPGQFVTSDQCLSCHDGQTLPFGPNMIIPATEDQEMINLSPYGEWNWSMMGLAGRDPIFYAQLESEISIHDSGDLPETIQNLCFRCHGVMGQRQFHLDDAGDTFTRDIVQVTDPADPNHKYGALARDGISCMVCHQIVDEGKPIQETMTGQFDIVASGRRGQRHQPRLRSLRGSGDTAHGLCFGYEAGVQRGHQGIPALRQLPHHLPAHLRCGRQPGGQRLRTVDLSGVAKQRLPE